MLVQRKATEKTDEYRAIVRAVHNGNVAKITTRNKPLEIRAVVLASIAENKPVKCYTVNGTLYVRKATKRTATNLSNYHNVK